MPDRSTKLQRWLDVIAYLAGRRYPASLEELREHVPAYALPHGASETEQESVRRKFERDKKELRELGIPIETVTFHINYGQEESHGYRLTRRDFHLPYLRLIREASEVAGTTPAAGSGDFTVTESEIGAALHGLQEIAQLPAFPLASHARSAFRKLAFDMEPEIVREGPVTFVQDAEAVATAEALDLLSSAVLGGKRVAFRYRGMHRDTDERRRVRPYSLLFQHGRWYLVAHDEARDAVRMFRVGRMSDVEVNKKAAGTPDFEVPEDFRPEEYAGRKAWELGEEDEGPVRATVLFRFPRSLWAERNGHGRLEQEQVDGSQLRTFDVHRRDPFLRWVLSQAGEAHVAGPDDLRTAFDALVSAVAARHQGEAVDD